MDEEELFKRNKTYVCHKNSTILAFNKPNTNNVFVESLNLNDELNDEKETHDEHLKIYLRIKQSECFKGLYEINDNCLHCKVPNETQCTKIFRENTSITNIYTFSKIFGPDTKQSVLFDDVIRSKCNNFVKGLNSTLLAYGASGSGKTYTIMGTPTEPGIIPRALEYLFRVLPVLPFQPQFKPTPEGDVKQLNEMESEMESKQFSILLNQNVGVDFTRYNSTYIAMQQQLQNEIEDITGYPNINPLGVWISFAEIYNENIHDLLTCKPASGQSRQKLQLGSNNGNWYIKNLKYVYITSALEAYTVLQYGLHNMNYAATGINDHSSRSHSIFTIKLAQSFSSKSDIDISSFNFCDLAGSERVKKTNNVGNRFKESKNINMSLLVLGKCISSIRDGQKYKNNRLIPFRESKLTLLFQKALLGHEIISLIVNINPIKAMFHENQHVLNFSAIAKDIKVVTEQATCKRKSAFLEHLQKKSDIPIAYEESNMDLKSELLMQVALLQNEIQQSILNFEEERVEMIAFYKKSVDDANKHGEKTYEKFKQHLIDILRENRKMSDKDTENDLKMSTEKQQEASIINIDSSSDEDELQIFTGKKRKVSAISLDDDSSSSDEMDFQNRKTILQKKLVELQQNYQINEAQIVQCKRKILELKGELEQAENDYINLSFQLENRRLDVQNENKVDTTRSDL